LHSKLVFRKNISFDALIINNKTIFSPSAIDFLLTLCGKTLTCCMKASSSNPPIMTNPVSKTEAEVFPCNLPPSSFFFHPFLEYLCLVLEYLRQGVWDTMANITIEAALWTITPSFRNHSVPM
jgi:hypothetical protein